MSKRTLRQFQFVPSWVNPEHPVAAALMLMRGYSTRVLAVKEGPKLLGFVQRSQLESLPGASLVSSAISIIRLRLDIETSMLEAAQEFVDRDADVAAIYSGDGFVGLLTASMLLAEVKRNRDDVTGLLRSDELRDWSISMLREGREISLLYLDLDDFRQYNKQFGHFVGDRVIQVIAAHLADRIDPDIDFLVRQGGDEFAIASLRNREGALSLKTEIEALAPVMLPELQSPVSFSVGLSGGRRTHVRSDDHLAAMFADLLTEASLQAQQAKQRKKWNELDPESFKIDY